ncbi:MAG: hypothetical protein K1X67_16200 [Fimbriimonadaceae bacterium]|nr:hypothetical protein [Fimbriimonadaceae bacterium]
MAASACPPLNTVRGGLFGLGPMPDSLPLEDDVLPDILKSPLSDRSAPRPNYQAIARALMGETLPPYRRPEAQANIANELQKPYWEVGESAAISMGIDPTCISIDIIRHHPADTLAHEYLRRCILVLRAQIIGDLPRYLRPQRIVAWALTRNLALPEGLSGLELHDPTVTSGSRGCETSCGSTENSVTAIAARAEELEVLLAEAREKAAYVPELRAELRRHRTLATSNTKVIKTQHCLIAAMATEKYGALKKSTRRDAVSKVVASTDRAGIGLSPDTVRKHLKESLAEIPAEKRRLLEG